MITPDRVQWGDLDDDTYEDMVSVLISWLHPEAQRLDGSGGDGGRDVQVPTDEGLVIYQLKSFTGRMNSSRRRKVKDSLETAKQHGPVKWYLVVPIDHTQGELDWFQDLVESCPFACAWLGKTWLDRHMAEKTQIPRYFARQGRVTHSEALEMLQAFSAGPPQGEGGILGAAADRVTRIVQQLSELDPFYVFGYNYQPDGSVVFSIIPRYRGAERDHPPFRVSFDFSDTAEGHQARRTFQDGRDYGTPGVVRSDFISELTLNVPAGFGTSLEGVELHVGSPAPHLADAVTMALRAITQSGEIRAQLPLFPEDPTTGARGVRFAFRDKSGSLTGTVRYDAPTSRWNLNWSYTIPGEFWPLDLLPTAKFMAALDHDTQVGFVVNGEALPMESPGTLHGADTGDAERFARLIDHLANLQSRTGVFFVVNTGFTAEEIGAMVLASRLLNGEHVETPWDELVFDVVPGGHQPISAALGDRLIHNVSIGSYMSIDVQGNTIPVGQVFRVCESAKVERWVSDENGGPPGTSKLYLVPAETNISTMFLDLDPSS